MAEIVETDFFQSVVFQYNLKMLCDEVWFDKRTFAFFNQNAVSEYSREQAIIDGVNVGEDIFLIETDVTKNGATILKQQIEYRDRLTRAKRWKQMDEDLIYTTAKLDRDVVNPSQIRTVIRAFRDNLFTQLFRIAAKCPRR